MPPTRATMGPAPMRTPPAGRGTLGGGAPAPGAPHAADGGPGAAGGAGGAVAVGVVVAVGGGGGAGVGAVTGAGAEWMRRRPSTHASQPFEQRMRAQSPRRSSSMTSRPAARFAAGATDPSGSFQAGSPSVGAAWVCVYSAMRVSDLARVRGGAQRTHTN